MIRSESPPTAVRPRTSPPAPATGVTIFGCGPDETALFGELAPRLGVVPTFTEAALSDATAHLALGNRCVSVDHKTPVGRSTLRALRDAGVAYVCTRSVGDDHIDVSYAASVGISVGTVAYSPDSVAEYTVMLMLMAVRHTAGVLRRAERHDYRLGCVRGRELRDLTVGVVGTGRIGAAVIERLSGFRCRTLAHDPRATRTARAAAGAEYVALDVLVEQCDIVTLHVPLTAATHHLLDARRIARMKPGAVVVNTGRGPLLETAALAEALEAGRLGGAALDVVEGEHGIFYADCGGRQIDNEPLRRLHALPNVVITPHTAYYTDHALRDIVEHSLINCLRFEGERRHG